jgi:hypothetical protein
LHAVEAVPDLANVLRVQRVRAVSVPVIRYFSGFSQAFTSQSQISLGSSSVPYTPSIGVLVPGTIPVGGTASAAGPNVLAPGVVDTVTELRDVTVFRTEVMEALKQITGENFGFDEAAWRHWYQETQQ